jgi:hypothetical protein
MENNENRIKPPRRRLGLQPAQVTLLENQDAFEKLLLRFAAECPAENIQEESDLVALGQLRWRFQRLEGVQNEATNWRIGRGLLPVARPEALTNPERLSLTVMECNGDNTYVEVQKQYLAAIKTMHALAGRVERRS